MGGRLSPSINNSIQSFPSDTWINEFQLAKKCGFDIIEWVFDELDNPILTSRGNELIHSLSEQNNVFIDSICADFFMKNKLFESNEINKKIDILKKLINVASNLRIQIIEIPLVDSSSMRSMNEKDQLFKNLKQILPLAEEKNVIINLETDLPPIEFKNYIESFESKFLRANYDVGNSISLGYDFAEELDILSHLITNVHIKDRMFNGPTVPLGTGKVNFELFFNKLSEIKYSGSLIIQGSRENESVISPIDTCKKYHIFVKHYLDKYFL